jgi:hypothetical protein
MTMRPLLAATLAAGLVLVPAAVAQDATKPAPSTARAHKTAKVHPKTVRTRPAGATKKHDEMMGNPYSMQKDEMTR